MIQRTVSGIVLVAVIVGLVLAGPLWWGIGLGVMSIIGGYEFSSAMKKGGFSPLVPVALGASAVYYVLILVFPEEMWAGGCMLFVGLVTVITAFITVLKYPKYKAADSALTVLGFFYVAVLFSFLYFLRREPDGSVFMGYVFLAAWGCDTFAYLAGRAFGKKKLVPELSPKKTVAGAIGGIIGSIVLCLVFTLVVRSGVGMSSARLYTVSVLSGLSGALFSQFGDLFASAMKRNVGVKDYGRLIPGHGGILDRFDSILLVTPVVSAVVWLAERLIP